MEAIQFFIDILLHLDKHLDWVIRTYGIWTYAILFMIIFCETGLVVTPFLPGDSLLFASGTFVAIGSLDMALAYRIAQPCGHCGGYRSITGSAMPWVRRSSPERTPVS